MPFINLDQVTTTRVNWLWPGRLAIGHLAILDGDPGLGKSLVTLDLCARITTGSPFPDGQPGTRPGNVVVLNGEDGVHDVIPGRLRAAGADFKHVQVFDRADGEADLRLPGQVNRLEEAVARRGACYVVLDPITAFLDTGVNLANDRCVRAALAPLAGLARRHRCVIHMVRHLNKSGGDNPLYRGLHSIGFTANCRVAWLIARDPKIAQQFVLAQPKSNLDPPQPSLTYAIEADDSGSARIAWRGPSPWSDRELLAASQHRQNSRLTAQEFLLSFLKDGPRTTRDIWAEAEPHGFSRRTLDRAREALSIRASRVKVGTPQQASYWVLPDQKFTFENSDMPQLEELLRKDAEFFPKRTPLD